MLSRKLPPASVTLNGIPIHLSKYIAVHAAKATYSHSKSLTSAIKALDATKVSSVYEDIADDLKASALVHEATKAELGLQRDILSALETGSINSDHVAVRVAAEAHVTKDAIQSHDPDHALLDQYATTITAVKEAIGALTDAVVVADNHLQKARSLRQRAIKALFSICPHTGSYIKSGLHHQLPPNWQALIAPGIPYGQATHSTFEADPGNVQASILQTKMLRMLDLEASSHRRKQDRAKETIAKSQLDQQLQEAHQ